MLTPSPFFFSVDGGDDATVAVSCSGGRRSDACFSARLMWRTDGQGELYTYLPPYTDSRFAANEKQCSVAPKSEYNPTYGASVGRGSFSFEAGKWTTVSQRVRLNDVGQANGELELFANGESVVKVDGLILRASDAGRLRGIQMQTFFGGELLPSFLLFDLGAETAIFSVQALLPTGHPPRIRTRTSLTSRWPSPRSSDPLTTTPHPLTDLDQPDQPTT